MPLNPLIPAIISTIINSVGDDMGNATSVAPTLAVMRSLPEEAKVGEMQPPQLWQVEIDGTLYRLSPGAQIRNELNMIVMPTMVQAPVKVRYQIDLAGAVHRVWILSAAEAALLENR